MLAGCPKARLMLSSQVWVPTIFILGLAVTMPWCFAVGPVPLAQDLAPLLNKGAPQRCRIRPCVSRRLLEKANVKLCYMIDLKQKKTQKVKIPPNPPLH